MDRNYLNNFERGPTKDHSCEVWSKSNKWFRRCLLKKLFTDEHTHGCMQNERRTKCDHKHSPCHYVTGELKIFARYPLLSGALHWDTSNESHNIWKIFARNPLLSGASCWGTTTHDKYLPDTHSYLEHLTNVLPMSSTTYEKIFARYPLLSGASHWGTSNEFHNIWKNICQIPTLIWSISLRYFQWVPQHMKKYLPDTHSYLEHLTEVLPMSSTTYEKIFARYPLLSGASHWGTSNEFHNIWKNICQIPTLIWSISLRYFQWVPQHMKKYLPDTHSYLEHLTEVFPMSSTTYEKIFARYPLLSGASHWGTSNESHNIWKNICQMPTLIWSISLRYFQWVPQHMKTYLPDTHSYLEHLTEVLPMSSTTYEKIFARYPLLSGASH